MNEELDRQSILKIVRDALHEDVGEGDITSAALIPATAEVSGSFVSKDEGVIAGLGVCEIIFQEIDGSVSFKPACMDGEKIRPGRRIAEVSGSALSVLSGERLALNLLGRLSGIATLTGQFVRAVEGTGAKIYDTRKTTPNLRILEKYAVRVGGGHNHRMGLFDQVLIKDNHIAIAKKEGLERLSDIVQKARDNAPAGTKIEIEVDSIEDFEDALAGRPDMIMLDNMTPLRMKKAFDIIRDLPERPLIEASGNITLENVREVASSGVDIISVGSLTHSARALDISLEFG